MTPWGVSAPSRMERARGGGDGDEELVPVGDGLVEDPVCGGRDGELVGSRPQWFGRGLSSPTLVGHTMNSHLFSVPEKNIDASAVVLPRESEEKRWEDVLAYVN